MGWALILFIQKVEWNYFYCNPSMERESKVLLPINLQSTMYIYIHIYGEGGRLSLSSDFKSLHWMKTDLLLSRNMIPGLNKYLCNTHSMQIIQISNEKILTSPICHFHLNILVYLFKRNFLSSEITGLY